MGHSLMIVGCLLGMDVRLCGPKTLWPAEEYIASHAKLQEQSGATLTITDDPKEAVAAPTSSTPTSGCRWASRRRGGRSASTGSSATRSTWKLMKASRNPQVRFMHCLPAFHDTETTIGKRIAESYGLKSGLEVTDDVFESKDNIAFEQAENRMHTIKATLVATLGD